VTTTTEHHELVEYPFRLGDWLVEPRLNRLTRGDESIQIEHKMMDVLVCLAEKPGDLVPRQHIIDTVWAIEFISEGTLTRIVAELRRALGDDAREPRFIETIRGKGYRLLVPVEMEDQPSATIAQFPTRTIDEDRNPYPGLAAFTETDAEFFFGRETEVAQLWRKITSRRLLAVIGPSGVGKTSFLRAGLLPAKPDGWGTLICQPGEAPFAAVARELAPRFEGDAETISKLVDINDESRAVAIMSRWRERHDQALLIVDQFEELFTLNPPEVQARFATLIGRLVHDADVHVLLSMRDDFLYRCHTQPPLRPILEDLTALDQPNRASLRRALKEPAARFGYRFENDDLVDEMVDSVAGERGALPLLAFAITQLWEQRDRERKLMTRDAYEEIEGVGGALARHAEATLKAIGSDHTPLVRELFRNLVTSEGTRAVREWNDLLSVFGDSQGESPEEVLHGLIDARLLTSYEIREGDEEPTRGVEVAHESLLTSWPRLVRWQTQDADAAQVRDQLRQAARTWQEHDRSDDLLWTGSVYREFAVWRERYPGGLTEPEEEFGEAMARHAERRKRRRRVAVSATIIVLLGVMVVIGGFWRRSVTEARRAEAANLFSLAQLQLNKHPTGTIAYTIASLELADNPEVRRLALEALWRGPTEFRLPTRSPYWLDFSSDGRWLATADPESGASLWPSDGGPPTLLEGSGIAMEARISPTGDLVAANMDRERQQLGLWSCPEGRFLRSIALGDRGLTATFTFSVDGTRLFTNTDILAADSYGLDVRSWPVEGGAPDLLAHFELPSSTHLTGQGHDPTGSRLAWAEGRAVHIAHLDGATLLRGSVASVEHDGIIAVHIFDKQGRQLATADTDGMIRVWSLASDVPELTRTLAGEGGLSANQVVFDPSGSMLAEAAGILWDLTGPPDAEPLRLGYPGWIGFGLAFNTDSRWLATSTPDTVSLWPLKPPYSRIFRGHEASITGVEFTPNGSRLVSSSEDGSVRIWPLDGDSRERSRLLYQGDGTLEFPSLLMMAPDGSSVVIGKPTGRVILLPLDGGPSRDLIGFGSKVTGLAVGPRSRLVAAGGGAYFREQALVRVWDLESGTTRSLDAGDGEWIEGLEFASDGDLWVASGAKLRRWQLDGGPPGVAVEMDLSVPDGTVVFFDDLDPSDRLVLLGADDGRLWVQDLVTGDTRELISHAGRSGWAIFDVTGEIVVSTDAQAGIRIGPATGEEPHLLVGPERDITAVAVSPDGRWIASGDSDGTIRLWPMPDLSKPPLHTLPREELIAKLKTLTNLRAVRDEASSTGWKIEVGPFPGWETVPSW
jgi:WD40 repeat protein/DNA-binding winged helix-turn-helix (wHTH) protein